MNELKEISELIPEETKKEIYKDGVKPTMIEAGKTLSLVPRVVKNALAKVEMWCINKEFMVKEFEQELQRKLESKNAENIVDADPNIFIPSAQAISYNWEKEDIKQLYLNSKKQWYRSRLFGKIILVTLHELQHLLCPK